MSILSVVGRCCLFFGAVSGCLDQSAVLTAFDQVSAARLREKNSRRYEFAQSAGAQFVPSSDGQTIGVLWYPRGLAADPNKRLLVTLHGHASLATDEFLLWQKFAERYRFGIFALQWWDLGDETNAQDYLKPNEVHRIAEQMAAAEKIRPGRAILHGFSRGSANSYAVIALDRVAGRNLFGVCISNAGGLAEDFPGNRIFLNDPAHANVFRDTHWIMYCGEKDPNRRDGVAAMQRSKEVVEKFGGVVDLFLQDPLGDHGGFHRNPRNTEAALQVVESLLPTSPPR